MQLTLEQRIKLVENVVEALQREVKTLRAKVAHLDLRTEGLMRIR